MAPLTSSAFARALPLSLSSRTVFIRVAPAPANFSERRAVLRALQKSNQNTEIEVFKKLEESSSFIVVTKSAEEAQKLLDESPFQRIFVSQDSTSAATFSNTSWGAAFRGAITDPVNVLSPEEAANRSSQLGTTAKSFTVRVFPANEGYHHERAPRQSHLHGPWLYEDNFDNRPTFISTALYKAIPANASKTGLMDWETGSQFERKPWPFIGTSALDVLEHSGPAPFAGEPWYIRERRRRRHYNDMLPPAMKGLTALS